MPSACCETNVKTTSGPKLLYGKKKVTNLWISSFLVLAINLKVKLLSLGTLGWSGVWVLEPAVFSLAMGDGIPCGPRAGWPAHLRHRALLVFVLLAAAESSRQVTHPIPPQSRALRVLGPQVSAELSEESWRVWSLA